MNSDWLISRFFLEKDSSVIDYPRRNLDLQIWNIEQEPAVLREGIKNQILNRFFGLLRKKFPNVNWSNELGDVHITGSIGTYQYLPWSDIDVHVIVEDWERLVSKYGEGFIEEVQSYVRSDEVSGWMIGDHSVNYYLQLDKRQDLLGDALYDVYSETWIVSPRKVNIEEFDPEEEFKEIWGWTKRWMDEFVLKIVELQRDIKDIESLEEWLEALDGEKLCWLRQKIESRIDEVNEDLEILSDQFTEIHEERKHAFVEHIEPEDVLEDWMGSRGLLKGNVQFKILEKYGLVTILAGLRHIEETEELTDKEKVREVKRFLKRFDLMFEKFGVISYV